MSQKVISAYERSYRIPPGSVIPQVAETLGTTPDSLYGSPERHGGPRNLRRRRLWEIVEKLEAIPEEKLENVFRLIDDYLEKR